MQLSKYGIKIDIFLKKFQNFPKWIMDVAYNFKLLQTLPLEKWKNISHLEENSLFIQSVSDKPRLLFVFGNLSSIDCFGVTR